jgi:hypothetical protein
MFFDGTETIPEWYRQEQMKHAQLQWAQHQQGTLNYSHSISSCR